MACYLLRLNISTNTVAHCTVDETGCLERLEMARRLHDTTERGLAYERKSSAHVAMSHFSAPTAFVVGGPVRQARFRNTFAKNSLILQLGNFFFRSIREVRETKEIDNHFLIVNNTKTHRPIRNPV